MMELDKTMGRYELLNNIAHRDLRVATAFGPEFGDDVGMVPAFPSEFAELQREYPIFLRKDATTGDWQSVVLLGFGLALMRLSRFKSVSWLARIYVSFFRGTPLLVQLFVIYYGLPQLGVELDPLPAALIGFSLNMAAYACEILRAAISSIERGQWEAAASIGMTRGQALRRAILPQAARTALALLPRTWRFAFFRSLIDCDDRPDARLELKIADTQDELDLHGATALQAESLLRRFLADAHAHDHGCVRVIHGKGQRSDSDAPVLKNLVDRILRNMLTDVTGRYRLQVADACLLQDAPAGLSYAAIFLYTPEGQLFFSSTLYDRVTAPFPTTGVATSASAQARRGSLPSRLKNSR